MKRFIYTLFLFVLSNALCAQSSHLVTVAELKQMANCPEYTCLGSLVNGWQYTYKGFTKERLNGMKGTRYRYVRPHPNPLFAEFTASYWVLSDDSRWVVLTSDNKTWSGGLERDINQNGFRLTDRKSRLASDDSYYELTENGLVWHLIWQRPSLFAESAQTVTIYREPGPTTAPVAASAPNTTSQPATKPEPLPISTEQPHLGGNWDTNYPEQNAADLLRAERQYATEYDRQHGKVGHTFSRADKVRIQGKRLGQYRPLTNERWAASFDLALRTTGFDSFANQRQTLYKQEALFDIAGERIWVPIQELLIKSLEKETRIGEPVTLYAVLTSYHDFSGTLHLSFLINEFASSSTANAPGSSAIPEPPRPTSFANTRPEPLKTQPEVAVPSKPATSSVNPKKTSSPCGFNWKAWGAVSAAERVAMKKVMVPDMEGGYVGSLLQYLLDEIKRGNTIQIARHDFYEKKQPGYVVYINYPSPLNGNKGRVEVYEDLGESYLFPSIDITTNLCSIRPAENNKGIICEDGRQEAFTNISLFFAQTYAQFLKNTKQENSPTLPATPDNNSRLGAKTPEDLAILLLKCLKTNDKATWMRCMHPDESVETDELSARRFDQYRECLDENGITNWPLVSYSRMTHLAQPNGSGGSRVDLTKTRSRVGVEFTYKNQEFIGQLSFGAFVKLDDKWLVWAAGIGNLCTVMRYMR